MELLEVLVLELELELLLDFAPLDEPVPGPEQAAVNAAATAILSKLSFLCMV